MSQKMKLLFTRAGLVAECVECGQVLQFAEGEIDTPAHDCEVKP